MYKVMGILKRPHGMSMPDFRKWWLEEHAPKVKKWAGLKRYCINLAITGDQRYDGVAEVWFETKADMDVVFRTPEGEAARNSAMVGSAEIVLLSTEENVMVGK